MGRKKLPNKYGKRLSVNFDERVMNGLLEAQRGGEFAGMSLSEIANAMVKEAMTKTERAAG